LFKLLDSTEEIANIRTLRKKIRLGTCWNQYFM